MAFNLVINIELKNMGKEEQINKEEQRSYVLQHYVDVILQQTLSNSSYTDVRSQRWLNQIWVQY